MDDISAFAKQVNYVPDHFSICAAETTLLKKLVAPLYGERPVVGIRELMQNSIDAVRERHTLERTPYESTPEITVRLLRNGDRFEFCVSDQGAGMTADIVRDYFLTAGASFRDSELWHSKFKKTSIPDVIRSGRFGVGVLAAFLIGPRISVVTRHYRAPDNEALSFVASLDDDEIEVTRTSREHPGTSIHIDITQETYDSLRHFDGEDWDWYRWSQPVVFREVDGKKATDLIRVAMPNAVLEPEWHRLATDDYEEVLWTYGRTPRLLVNGMVVGSEGSSRGYSCKFEWAGNVKRLDMSNPLQVPYVSITDRNGECPVDLQRFALALNRFPFRESLMAAAAEDFVAFLLLSAPTALPEFRNIRALRSLIQYPGRESNRVASFAPVVDYGFTAEGIVPLHWANLCQYSPAWASVVLSFVNDAQFPQFSLRDREMVCFATMAHTHAWQMMLPTAVSNLLGRENAATGPHSYFFTRNEAARLLMPPQVSQMLLESVNTQVDFYRVDKAIVQLEVPNGQDIPLATWKVGQEITGLTHERAEELSDVIFAVLSQGSLFAELCRPSVHISMQDNTFARLWRDLMPDPVIPYDIQVRKSRFAETYQRVAQYLQKWEVILAKPDWRQRFWRNNHTNERL